MWKKLFNKLLRTLYTSGEAVVNYWPSSMVYSKDNLSERIRWSQSIVAPFNVYQTDI